MHNVKHRILIALLVCASYLPGQNTLSLSGLYDAAAAAHPYQRLKTAAQNNADLRQQINKSIGLPQANLTGQASWQSDVTKIDVPLPGFEIPGQPKDQYRAVLELSQSLLDGGALKSGSQQITQANQVEQANADVLLYNIKESICRSYFGAQIAELTMEQMQILIKDLEDKVERLQSQIAGGIASGYQQEVLQVKIAEARQGIREAQKNKQSAINTLQILSGTTIGPDDRFNDNIRGMTNGAAQRPELRLFEAQKNLQIAQYDQSLTRYRPRVNAFAQLGYGRPSLNVLSDKFKGYSIFGLRAQWNLSDLYLHHRDKEKSLLTNNLSNIQAMSDAFDLQQKTKIAAQNAEIESYIDLVREDEKVITLYEKILISSNAQFENGISTINDYSNDANNLAQAKIRRDVHQSMLMQSKELLSLLQGK
ncbi:MAG: TolC family protein [Saprospiraceae bacterium]|nr:TolC family protein [Saprospiraceae bacterium]